MTHTDRKQSRRVLIAGAKFGEVYLNAFLQPQAGLELAGLLARGSRRAQQLAHDFGIPLYTSLEQLPDDIDIACVVVRSTVAQGEGSQLAADLLRRGIHVLQEHPLHPDDVARLQALADESNLVYWINSFYPNIPAGRCWIEKASRIRSLLEGQKPCSAQLTTSRQLLYSMLDLLLQACGLVDGNGIRVEVLDGSDDCFVPLRLVLPGGSQAVLRLQAYLDPSDPDMFSLVMHRASLAWPSGYLTLESSYGPVLWTGVFHDPQHGSDDRTMYRGANAGGCYAQPTSMVLRDAPGSWRDAFEIDGAAGIAYALRALRQVLDGASVPAAFSPAYQLALARLWLAVLHVAPPIVERHLAPPRLITWDDLNGAEASKAALRGTHG
ncbi:Gfo/Idh/MocA family oxidoreductase [Pollutimonas bauzanensis]|uniref:Yersiniabactin synthetase, thiazolinyl reductase component n=1 Tax=Pollutimonas bauzanensis TaxID=658167 RepID=A0A1M5ZMG8_9BURK|nr:Gfo/Idh/MocA family oxidoreductase [Pollutimonas bauzanensis]SHI25545.1 yersiniabactin synthetase, thiazolinyl reductase component [Pollutimonas bauzanensis]